MSSGRQHKMYNWEVTPPAGAWDKISSELDESELSAGFPSRLYNAAIAPPAAAWTGIATALDEELFIKDYSQKLVAAEVIPPIRAWEKIQASLDPAETLSTRKRIPLFIKYAAAAAIIALVAWGGLQVFQNKNTGDTVAKSSATETGDTSTNVAKSNPVITPVDETVTTSGIAASVEEARNDAALEASKKTYAKLDIPAVTHTKLKNVASFFFVSDDYNYSGDAVTRSPGSLSEDPAPPTNMTDPSRYVAWMTPDGHLIRMSTKLKDIVCCVAGEDDDKTCVDQMKRWREKIANPAKAHSTGNFLDIVSMIHSLQDN